MKKGEQVRIPAPGTHQKPHVFGAWNYAKDQIHYPTHCKKPRHGFLTFLKYLVERRRNGRFVVLVLDNASYHHARIVREYLGTLQNRVFAFWLPAYAPELNLIERVWKHSKQVGLNNFYFETLDNLERSVHCVFDAVNLKKMTLGIAFKEHKELTSVT